MTQTSFLLSGLSSGKAPMGEGKAVFSADTPDTEGEGFFAQLVQLVSGDGVSGDEKLSDVSMGEALLAEGNRAAEEAVSDILLSAQAEGDEGETEDFVEEDANIDVASLQSEEVDVLLKDDETTSDEVVSSQSAKKDGEALLQRLNESNQVLSPKVKEKPEEAATEMAGKTLPSAQIKQAIVKTETSDEELTVLEEHPVNTKMVTKSAQPDTLDEDGKPLANLGEPTKKVKTPDVEEGVVATDEALTIKDKPIDDLDSIGQVSDKPVVAKSETATEQEFKGNTQVLSVTEKPAIEVTEVKGAEIALMTEQMPPAPAFAQPQVTQKSPSEVEITPELIAKASVAPELLTRAQRDALIRAQTEMQHLSASEEEQQLSSTLSDLRMRATTPTSQAALSQTASAVQAAVNPQAQQASNISPLAAIPWTPAAMQVGNEKQSQITASQTLLDATASKAISETSRSGSEAKTEGLAQQLASSFGQQGSATTAAKLDTAVAQTPLQMSQNQAQAAEQLSERVNIMMSKNLKHVDIRLDPPELGRMQIKLSMNNDQANVQITVSNQAAREMIEQSLPRLREMMQQQGLQLAQSSVQHQDAGGRQSFAGQSSQGEGQPGSQSNSGDSSRSGWGENGQDSEHLGVNHELYVNTSKDRVDYYA